MALLKGKRLLTCFQKKIVNTWGQNLDPIIPKSEIASSHPTSILQHYGRVFGGWTICAPLLGLYSSHIFHFLFIGRSLVFHGKCARRNNDVFLPFDCKSTFLRLSDFAALVLRRRHKSPMFPTLLEKHVMTSAGQNLPTSSLTHFQNWFWPWPDLIGIYWNIWNIWYLIVCEIFKCGSFSISLLFAV